MSRALVCAAVRMPNGLIIPGPRHWDPTMRQLGQALRFTPGEYQDGQQGFIDQLGQFYTRGEAAKIAYENGQITVKKVELYSEDLY